MIIFFGILSILFHIVAFMLESVFFMNPKVYRQFGLLNKEEATIVKLMAFNQGFYNLFLALGMTLGLTLYINPHYTLIGSGIMIGPGVCMTGAGVILLLSEPKAWHTALVQGIPPLIILVILSTHLSSL
jgi:putative membrane protein